MCPKARPSRTCQVVTIHWDALRAAKMRFLMVPTDEAILKKKPAVKTSFESHCHCLILDKMRRDRDKRYNPNSGGSLNEDAFPFL